MSDRKYDDQDPCGPWFYAYRSPRVRVIGGVVFVVLGIAAWLVLGRLGDWAIGSLLFGGVLMFWGAFTARPKRHEWDD
jgi:hypothetical protein